MPDLADTLARRGEPEATRLTFEERDRSGDDQYQPTPDAKTLIEKVDRLWKERENYKRPHERVWFQTIAAILGNHWITWVQSLGTFQIPATSARLKRARVTVNKMQPYYLARMARLTAHRPGWHVAPNNTDPEAVERAELQTHFLDGEWERLNGQEILKDVVGYMLQGNVVVGPRWNPNAGEAMTEEQPVTQQQQDPLTGQVVEVPVVDPQSGRPATKRVPVTDPETGEQLHMGQMEVDVFSAFEFDFDWNATSLKDAGWCMRSSIKSLDWVRKNYPKFGKFVKGEDVYVDNLWLKRARQLVGLGTTQQAELEGERVQNACLVKEYWESPTVERPKGRLVVIANGVLLFDGENPYWRMIAEGFNFPYLISGEVRIPGRAWFHSRIEQAFPLNRQLNRAYSQEEMNRAIVGGGKWFIPNGADIPETALTAGDEGVEKVAWTPTMPGAKPEVLVPPSTTEAANAIIAHIERNIQDVLGYHEVSFGIKPQGDSSGIMVDRLQQADETSVGHTEGNLRDLLVSLGKMKLCIGAQFWTEDRLIKRTGWDGSTIARAVGGDALAGGEGDRFDVRVTPQSTMWKDPKAQREMVFELQKMGYLDPTNPAHRTLGLKMLDRADIQEIYKGDKLDIENSGRENIDFTNGIQNIPQPFENHALCIDEHNNFRKSERYRNLPDEYKLMADQHVAMHEQLEVIQAQKQAAREVAAMGPKMAAQAAQGQQGPTKKPQVPQPKAA